MSSLIVSAKDKRRSCSVSQKNKNIDYKIPNKKRNNSTVITNTSNIESMPTKSQRACCKGSNTSSNKLCKDCLTFILNNVDLKQNLATTVRKTCNSAHKIGSKKKLESNKSQRDKLIENKMNLTCADTQKQKKGSASKTSKVDKYTQLKLKEISKKQIIASMRSPLVKKTKKNSPSMMKSKNNNGKKSTRTTNFFEPTREEETFSISQINPFGLQEENRTESPTFSGHNTQNNNSLINQTQNEEKQQFSFEIKSEVKSHFQKMIEELKDTNQKLKQNLFESYQKYTKNVEENHEEILKINEQNSQKTKHMNQEIETYKIKWMNAESIIQQKEKENKKIIEKSQTELKNVKKSHRQEIMRNKRQYEQKIGNMQKTLEEKNEANSRLNKKIKDLQIDNDKLRIIMEEKDKKISKITLDVNKLAIDNEVYLKRIGKLNSQKQFILQNSRTVLSIIQTQIHQGDEKYGILEDTENLEKNDPKDKQQRSPKKSILQQNNY